MFRLSNSTWSEFILLRSGRIDKKVSLSLNKMHAALLLTLPWTIIMEREVNTFHLLQYISQRTNFEDTIVKKSFGPKMDKTSKFLFVALFSVSWPTFCCILVIISMHLVKKITTLSKFVATCLGIDPGPNKVHILHAASLIATDSFVHIFAQASLTNITSRVSFEAKNGDWSWYFGQVWTFPFSWELCQLLTRVYSQTKIMFCNVTATSLKCFPMIGHRFINSVCGRNIFGSDDVDP